MSRFYFQSQSGRSSGAGSRTKSRDGHRGSHAYLTPSQQSLQKALVGFTQQAKEEDLETVLDLESKIRNIRNPLNFRVKPYLFYTAWIVSGSGIPDPSPAKAEVVRHKTTENV